MLAQNELSHKTPVKDPWALKHNAELTAQLKTFVLNNQTLHAHTVMRTTLRLRVQDRAHFRENNFYQYRQRNGSYKSAEFSSESYF